MANKKPEPDSFHAVPMKYEDVPLEGSLGLLAAGYKGILLWRNKRKEHMIKVMDEKISLDNHPKTDK